MCELNRILFSAEREALKVSRHRVALQKSLRQKYAPLQPEQQEPRLKGGNGTRYISLQRLGHGKKAYSPPFHRLRNSLVALRLLFTETGGGEVLQHGPGSAI